MPLFNATDRRFACAISKLTNCNPFLPERMELEREALGKQFDDSGAVWSRQSESDDRRANIERLQNRVEQLTEQAYQSLCDGAEPDDDDLAIYEDLVCYLLYYRYFGDRSDIDQLLVDAPKAAVALDIWYPFSKDVGRYLKLLGRSLPSDHNGEHLFACFFQVRRAFFHIFDFIVGGSLPAARLRATVWQSIFTHDIRRYRRSLYSRMGDITTLVTGPSGTGKELVARAIGLSRYIPFDSDSRRFVPQNNMFNALNLSALSPTLIESELFGHRRGAFTGALDDHIGWLEQCPALGTVFLDEIGDLDASIQVKLLRVLQTRSFQRLGETEPRRFEGKIIAATNRDLAIEMRDGRFREDFYYRLCSDLITTPSLYDQLAESGEELPNLVLFISRREASEEAEQITEEVVKWINEHLGPDYAWPGNIRELEQCIRNVMIRQQYNPPYGLAANLNGNFAEHLARSLEAGQMTADELLRQYCTLVYSQTGSYERAAQILKIDRRTVKSRIDHELLSQITR